MEMELLGSVASRIAKLENWLRSVGLYPPEHGRPKPRKTDAEINYSMRRFAERDANRIKINGTGVVPAGDTGNGWDNAVMAYEDGWDEPPDL